MEKIKIIFGKQAVNSFLNEGVTALKKNDIDGLCLVREFATKAEKQAYLMGLEDCDGWENYYILDEEEAKKTLFADEIEQLRFVSDRRKRHGDSNCPTEGSSTRQRTANISILPMTALSISRRQRSIRKECTPKVLPLLTN